ncbi:hypothetical protein [Leucobacter sp. wl10]|nr:hypothetical protein [Leucobacter sp. wl10]
MRERRASVLVGSDAIRTETRPVPSPAADEVLVRALADGVCGFAMGSG